MRRVAIPLLACTLALTACGEDEDPEVTAEDVARIEQTLMNGSELAWELVQTEARVAAMCMQDLGFEIHEPYMLHGSMTPDRFEGFASPYSLIPTVEQAEKFAFAAWLEYEFAMALDFAECAEDAGLREGTEEAWAKQYVEQFSGREAEVFAWEEGIRDDLANAQDYLAGA